MTRLSKLGPIVLLLIFSLTTTLTLQRWVGGATIYAPDLEGKRLLLHQAILTNTLPAGVRQWKELGANGTNVRVATVYAADAIARFTRWPVLRVYRLIDTGCLVLFFPLLFVFLRRWVRDSYATIGVVFAASILPLTYFLYVFHPWDRPSLLAWLLLLYLLVSKRLVAFTIVLAVSLLIKFDTILVPALFFLVYWQRERPWGAVARTAALFAMTFAIFAGLIAAVPGGGGSNPMRLILQQNLSDLRALNVAYPPLLAFLLPGVLAVIGFRAADRAAKSCAIFAVGMTMVFVLQSNFREVRAEMSLLLLILPCALVGLTRVLCDQSRGTSSPQDAHERFSEVIHSDVTAGLAEVLNDQAVRAD